MMFVVLSNEVQDQSSDIFIYEFEGSDKVIKIEEVKSPIINDVYLDTASNNAVVEKSITLPSIETMTRVWKNFSKLIRPLLLMTIQELNGNSKTAMHASHCVTPSLFV